MPRARTDSACTSTPRSATNGPSTCWHISNRSKGSSSNPYRFSRSRRALRAARRSEALFDSALIRRQEVHVDLQDERCHRRPVNLVGTDHSLISLSRAGGNVPRSVGFLLVEQELANPRVPFVPRRAPSL